MNRRAFLGGLLATPFVAGLVTADSEVPIMPPEGEPFSVPLAPSLTAPPITLERRPLYTPTLYAAPETVLDAFAARFAERYAQAGVRSHLVMTEGGHGDKVGYVIDIDGRPRVYTSQLYAAPALDIEASVLAGADLLAKMCLDAGLTFFGALAVPPSNDLLFALRTDSILKGLSVRFVGAACFNVERLCVETIFRFDVIGGRA